MASNLPITVTLSRIVRIVEARFSNEKEIPLTTLPSFKIASSSKMDQDR